MSDSIDRQAAIDGKICIQLADAYDGFPAQVTIKNCRDCTFNIYPSQMRMVEAEGSEE